MQEISPKTYSTFKINSHVKLYAVSFYNLYDMKVDGLFFSDKLDRNQKHATIILGHTMGAVKEQSADVYASNMAGRGFITLASTYRFGWKAKVRCVTRLHRIYMPKISAPLWTFGEPAHLSTGKNRRNSLNRAQILAQRKKLIAEGAEQNYIDFNGGATKYTGRIVPKLEASEDSIQREFYAFYCTLRGEYTPKGATKATTARLTFTSNVKFMNFCPFNDIETISPRPAPFISGSGAHSREFSKEGCQLAAEPKEMVIIPGAGHVDLYNRTDLILFQKIANFFNKYLQ